MIITVTLNPALDKTIELEKLFYGGLNRIESPIADAGGKGINVSKTIKALGGDSLATGFLGKEGSDAILKSLEAEGIEHDFILVEGVTRTNLKIIEKDGTLTELNEQGMTVPKDKTEELLAKLEAYAKEDVLFVLAGSIPKGVDSNIYACIIEKVKAKGAKTFVDADGELFANAMDAVPDMIKPNHVELTGYFKEEEDASKERIIELGKQLLEKGISYVAISRGSKGGIFLCKETGDVLCYDALPVKVNSAVGAGDAMAGALAYSFDREISWEDGVRLSMAASAGAVMTEGTKPPNRELVEELLALRQV